MTVNEAIQELESRKAFLMQSCVECWDPAMEMALQALKATQWRKGCPFESGEYIVMIKGARRSTFLLYDEESDIWHDKAGNFYTVTHWMPLPQPPEVNYD